MRRASQSRRARPRPARIAGRCRGGPDGQIQSEAVPIPGFPHTGNILGAGAAVHAEYRSKGPNTADSRPDRRRQLLPAPRAPSCTRRASRPARRPRSNRPVPRAARSPRQRARSAKCWGSSPSAPNESKRRRRCESFYAPGGGLEFFTTATRPCRWKSCRRANTSTSAAQAASGRSSSPKSRSSRRSLAPLRVGQVDQRQGGLRLQKVQEAVSYGRVPKKCPKGGFPIKTEMIFDEGGANPPVPEPVTATYKAPCPKK